MRSFLLFVAVLGCSVGWAYWLHATQEEIEANAIQREHACQYRQQRDDLRDYLERRDKVAWEPREGYAPWYSADGERVVLYRWQPEGVR